MALRKGSAEALVQIIGEDKISALIDDIKKKVSSIAEDTEKNVSATERLRTGWRQTSNGIQAVIGLAREAAQMANLLADAAREGASSIETSARFGQQFSDAVGGAEGAMRRLVEASRGALDDTSVKQYALQTRRMGLDIQQTSVLLELAGKISAESGQTFSESADVMFKAIATGESGALKAMGIQIDLEKHIGAAAKRMGGSAEAMHQSTRAQLNYNEVARAGMEALGDVSVDPVIDNIDRVGAAYRNNVSKMQEAWARKVNSMFELYEKWKDFDPMPDWLNIDRNLMGPKVLSPEQMTALQPPILRIVDRVEGARQAWQAWQSAIDGGNDALSESVRELTLEERVILSHTAALREAVDTTILDRAATLDNTIAKAEYAKQLGELVLAEELFTQASQIATTVQDGEAEATRLATEAIIIKNRAMIELLQTQLMVNQEQLRWDPTLSPGQRAQLETDIEVLAERLKMVTTPVQLRATPGFEDRTPTAPTAARGPTAAQEAARIKAELAAFKEAKAAGAEAAAAAMKQAVREQQMLIDESIRDTQEKLKAEADAYKMLMSSVTEASAAGLSDSIGMMGQLGGEFAQLGQGISGTASIIVSEFDRMNSQIDEFTANGMTSADAWEKNTAALIASGGQLTAGFIKDTTARAAVLSAFEFASGVAALFTNPAAASTHFLASALYAGVAGMSSAGTGGRGAGGGGRSAPRVASLGPDPVSEKKQPTSITINMSGAMIHGGNKQQFIRTLASDIQKETSAQSAPPAFMMG